MQPALATVRKPILVAAALGVLALALLLILARAGGPSSAFASSHSEAPLISQDPRADNTDLYAFVSPDKTNTVTMIANYIPLEQPASGPNFYSFDDTVLYEIKVDNNGDGRDDLAYQFRFHTATRNPNTFLYNTGPITSLSDPNWNRPQTYSVTLVHFNSAGQQIGKGQLLGSGIPTPPDNIGPRSTPSYNSLAAAAVTSLPGGIKVFAGQRDDPFFVDLGSIFDLAGLRPFNPFHLLPLAAEPGRDALKNDNVHSIEIQVPTSQLVSFSSPTIGIYATASRQKVRVLKDNGTVEGHGPWVQVSRLGNPLINEVVIPLGQKDFWNREDPEDDQQFESLYTSPEVSRLENALYGTLPQGHAGGALSAIDDTGRSDLRTILLTGIPGVNFTGNTDADLLRLNTAILPGSNGACPAGTASSAQPDRLGPLGASGDLCGYPNGRRLGDDVIDIDLRAFAQGYGPFLHTALGLPDKTPNDLLGDGVDTNDVSFSGAFPYVAAPHQGYEVP
ncbi:MAG TPA: DUF4331 domain-containing protein [Gaiellaceae bacterium]|nr:DUF4331 domain-containing protein [Gaiellaceae bacterium]